MKNKILFLAVHLFYLHGGLLEQKDLPAFHPKHGRYEYEKIIRAFEEKGFVVHHEIRGQAPPQESAEGLVRQVRGLMQSGVSPQNIVLAGFSKGGVIALMAAAKLGEPQLRTVLMAACGERVFVGNYSRILEEVGPKLKGKFLSLYDSSDPSARSCSPFFNRAADSLQGREKILHTGLGHGLFFTPRPEWMEVVVPWIQKF